MLPNELIVVPDILEADAVIPNALYAVTASANSADVGAVVPK